MAEDQFDEAPPLGMPGRDHEKLGEQESVSGFAGQLVTQPAAPSTFQTQGFMMTAKAVEVHRNHRMIMANLKSLCAANGARYVYSWEVKDNRRKRKVTIEGPTIKMANDLARIYGNCFSGIVEVKIHPTHWEYLALFLDLETGYNTTRPFMQRRNQSAGMKDSGREEDIAFQIGASKAIRNVTVNALGSYVDYCMEESKKNLLDWVTANKDKAIAYVEGKAVEYNIPMVSIEAVLGRKKAQWTPRNVAMITMQLRSVDEGMASADDMFPTAGDAEKILKETDSKEKAEDKPSGEDKKPVPAQTTIEAEADKPEAAADPTPEPAKRKRGRPPKAETEAKKEAEAAAAKGKPEVPAEEAPEPEPEANEEPPIDDGVPEELAGEAPSDEGLEFD